jgi:hypothetical protein
MILESVHDYKMLSCTTIVTPLNLRDDAFGLSSHCVIVFTQDDADGGSLLPVHGPDRR